MPDAREESALVALSPPLGRPAWCLDRQIERDRLPGQHPGTIAIGAARAAGAAILARGGGRAFLVIPVRLGGRGMFLVGFIEFLVLADDQGRRLRVGADVALALRRQSLGDRPHCAEVEAAL